LRGAKNLNLPPAIYAISCSQTSVCENTQMIR